MNEVLEFNNHEKKLAEERAETTKALASLMHESWRKNRLNSDSGTYEPRIKTTKDEAWISVHNGTTEVDIANTSFEELPADWQEENYLSAKVAIEKIEDVLYLIHDKWLDRNDEYASAEQKTQYSRLPKTEKLKDVKILEEAIEIIKEKSN